MTEGTDELEKLLLDVRKTISDNKLFIEKLADETTEEDSEEAEPDVVVGEEGFEEL
jgi:hypothetical protein